MPRRTKTAAKPAPRKSAKPAKMAAAEVAQPKGSEFHSFLSDLIRLAEQHLGVREDGAKAPAAVVAKAGTADERRAELEAMSLRALRTLAKKLEFNPAEVNKADAASLVASVVEFEFGDAEPDEDDEADEDEGDEEDEESDEEEDEDESDEDEDEEAEYTREELQDMNLRTLKKIAKENDEELTTEDLAGLDADSVIDIILGEGEEEDEDEEDDEEEDEDEEDADEYTYDELKKMSVVQLKNLAKEWGARIPRNLTTPAKIAKHMSELEWDEE